MEENMIVRRVGVNRALHPEEVLYSIKFKEGKTYSCDNEVVDGMPRGRGTPVDVHFFKLGRVLTDDELEMEYERRGLMPDPYSLFALHKADPAFADQHPSGTHWVDKKGRWCILEFRLIRKDGSSRLYTRVGLASLTWPDLWFAGIRK